MEIGHIIPHIEALIFATDRPLGAAEITELINNAFGFMEDKITPEQVQSAIDGIVEKYNSEFYPFELRESGGGWQFLTKKEYHKTVAQLNGEKFMKRLSPAALETLAIIAYKQPITKSDIEAIRGVSCDYSIQKLLEKELIVITGRNEEMPGKPLVYATSKTFMDYFGLNSPDELPKLREVFDENVIAPTNIQDGQTEEIQQEQAPDDADGNEENDSSPTFVVTETGELQEALDAPADVSSAENSNENQSSDQASEEPPSDSTDDDSPADQTDDAPEEPQS